METSSTKMTAPRHARSRSVVTVLFKPASRGAMTGGKRMEMAVTRAVSLKSVGTALSRPESSVMMVILTLKMDVQRSAASNVVTGSFKVPRSVMTARASTTMGVMINASSSSTVTVWYNLGKSVMMVTSRLEMTLTVSVHVPKSLDV